MLPIFIHSVSQLSSSGPNKELHPITYAIFLLLTGMKISTGAFFLIAALGLLSGLGAFCRGGL